MDEIDEIVARYVVFRSVFGVPLWIGFRAELRREGEGESLVHSVLLRTVNFRAGNLWCPESGDLRFILFHASLLPHVIVLSSEKRFPAS